MKTTTTLVLLAILFYFASSASAVVTFDWATVGNPGNNGDTEVMWWDDTTGYGSVAYTYRISKYEVTAGQYTEFLNAVAASDPYHLYSEFMWSYTNDCRIERSGSSGSYTYSVASDREDRPVNYVSWGDAARFTNWLHNGQPTGQPDLTTTEDGAYFLNGATTDAALLAVSRQSDATYFIPSEDEWYKAAYYDPTKGAYFDYPTGSNSIPSNDLINPDPGNNANFYQNGYTIGIPYDTTPVGEFENSASPYGTFDQGGNVWEWNEAILSGLLRGVRGGDFGNDYAHLHAGDRINYFPADEGIGFRVASVIPEPSCITLMACMGLVVGMLRRRGMKSPLVIAHCDLAISRSAFSSAALWR